MKKKLLRSIICFLLSVIMITECNLGAIHAHASEVTEETELEEDSEESVEEEIITASSYLYPFEEAVTALEELAAAGDIQAVVYLSDIITLRTLPEEGSEPVKNLNSGDVVSIIGVGQDAEYNIWYRVSYKDEIEEVTGYVRKDNVACVDQEFTKWQESYVRSISMFGGFGIGYSAADIEEFPESYQDALYALKEQHPNWIFAKIHTNVDWNTFAEKQVGNKSWIVSSVKESWKNGPTPTKGWSYASKGIIKYYLDPRNWLSEKEMFQFEMLGYSAEYHTLEAVEGILSGSFMSNTLIDNTMTYGQAFVELGRTTDVSPFFLAARVLQEQGYSGSSDLISGNYPGYEGYYNYYNIGAFGNGHTETIVNGLQMAKNQGWNTRYKALKAGIEFLMMDYISVGQNTLYMQKFDFIGSLANHQYMQNIQAPSQEGRIVYRAYSNKGLLDQGFIFRIPVYNNMPTKAVPLPGEEDKITLSSTKIDNLQVDSEITLHPYVNGKEAEGLNWSFTSSNAEVAIVDSNGVVKALKAGETTITCKSVDDPDNPNVGTCKITVIPADIDVTKLDIPVLEDITYDPNATLKDIALPTGYAWVNPDIVPVVAQSAYGVVYSPDEEKYNPIVFNLTLNVKKKVLTSKDYSIPTGLEGGANRELNSVSLPIGFSWNNPQEKLADTIGIKEYPASYNPDSANYETATDIKISVKIVCEKHEFSEWKITEATCETDGTKIRKCTICESKEELVLEKTGHLYESVITVEATEEEEGIRTYTCKNCDDSYTESIPKLPSTHVHKYEETVIKKASCTEDGEKAFECSCGDKYSEIIDAKGHNVENGRCQQCGYADVVDTPEDSKQPDDDGNKDNEDTDKPNDSGSNNNADINKPSDSGSNNTTDTNKPSDSGSNNNVDTNKPSDSGSNTTDTNKPSDSGSNNESSEDKNNTSGDSSNSGNSGTTDSNTNNGNSSNTGAGNSESNSGAANNNVTNNNSTTNSNTNNTTTNNSNTTNNSSANSTTTNNSNTVNNSSTNSTTTNNSNTVNNSSANSTTTNNSNTTNNNVVENTADTGNKTDEAKPQNPETSTVVQTQTKPESNVNQVEVELMSELVENAKEEESNSGEKQTVAIQLNKNTEISQKIVEMAKEHGVDLEVSLPNSLKWTISADTLNDEMVSAINMNAEIVEEVIEKKVIESVTSGEEYIELSLSHDGEFGFEATLTIPVEEKYVGQIANLFYFNEKTGELEYQMDTPVDEEGNIQLFFNHASDYVIVFSQNSMADVVTNLDVISDSNTEETTKDMPETEEPKNGTNQLLVICIIIMILAGGLAAAGYFIYFNKKEISDGQDFDEWLKEDKGAKVEKEPEINSKKTLKQESKQEKPTEKYLDDDVDDYREKETVTASIFNTAEIRLKEEEYLDDDVDDYQEKHSDEKVEDYQDDYLDDGIDDYKEKN